MNGEEITGSFYEKELQKTNQKEFRIEKVLKTKGTSNCMSNGKGMIIVLIVGLIKKTLNEIFKSNFINESFKCNFLIEIF